MTFSTAFAKANKFEFQVLPRQNKTSALSAAIAIALFTPFFSFADDKSEAKALDAIIVTASPLGERADQTVQPVAVVSGKRLSDLAGAQAGGAVEHLPGVQGSFFGAGVSRPIIRGLEGSRVQVLSSGIASMDASTFSPDHAVSIEPFLADQIEVLKGPATLIYGPGAIGGVVNIADGRLPEAARLGVSGRADLGADTGADQRLGAVRLDAGVETGAGSWLLHADGVYRNQDDYDVPNQDAPLSSTSLRSRNGAVSASYFGDAGRAGVALSRYTALYGIPEAAADAVQAKSSDAAEGVRIDLKQNRIDVNAALFVPVSGIEQIELRFGNNDYQHVEIEGGAAGTLFDVQSNLLRLEAVHAPLSDSNKGAFGLTHDSTDFKAIGEEAFVPFSKSKVLGLFGLEHFEYGAWHTDVGLRFDRASTSTVGKPKRSDTLSSFSLLGAYALSDREAGGYWELSAGFDRAQRAPVAEELYSDGAHIATQSFEIGDDTLRKETANNIELGLHFHGDESHFALNAYQNRFNDFIYQRAIDQEMDDLPVRLWTQADARFTGFEAEASMTLHRSADYGVLEGALQFDTVNARLNQSTEGSNRLPRIAPQRFGANVNWDRGAWHANVSVMRYAKQSDVAPLEQATAGYTRVDFDATRSFANSDESLTAEIYLRVRNATNQLARAHTSFLKEFAPLPGRNVGFGVRLYW
jgi:iron complex outermembrane recepter protein